MERKVAIINSVYDRGSTGRICSSLFRFLTAKGFDVKTFYGRNKNRSLGGVYFGTRLDNIIHCLFTRFTDKHGLFSKKRTKKLIRMLESYNPDIYILNNLHGYYINYELIFNFIKNSNKPIIWIFHDCWNFTGHCAHFDYNKCEKWKTGCYNCKFKNEYPAAFFDNSKNNFDKKQNLFVGADVYIVSPSSWLSGLIKQSFFRNTRCQVIHNGIDLNVFHKKDNPVFRDKYHLHREKLILCVSNKFTEKKGFRDILSLSSIIDDNSKIVLVGKCNSKKKLPKNIIHIPHTNSVDQLVDIYSSCNVFFNPTYEDNYPTVNLEAAACGLPVICYKTGGAVENVDPNYVVEQGDIFSAQKLFEKLSNGKSNYNFSSVPSFSETIMMNKYLLLISDLLSKK